VKLERIEPQYTASAQPAPEVPQADTNRRSPISTTRNTRKKACVERTDKKLGAAKLEVEDYEIEIDRCGDEDSSDDSVGGGRGVSSPRKVRGRGRGRGRGKGRGRPTKSGSNVSARLPQSQRFAAVLDKNTRDVDEDHDDDNNNDDDDNKGDEDCNVGDDEGAAEDGTVATVVKLPSGNETTANQNAETKPLQKKKGTHKVSVTDNKSSTSNKGSATGNTGSASGEKGSTAGNKGSATNSKDSATGNKKLSCEQCGKLCHGKISLEKHMKTHNEPKKLYPCTICPKVYHSARYLKVHLDKHAGIRYKCDICFKTFFR
jgi:hypothetical protein